MYIIIELLNAMYDFKVLEFLACSSSLVMVDITWGDIFQLKHYLFTVDKHICHNLISYWSNQTAIVVKDHRGNELQSLEILPLGQSSAKGGF